MDTLGIALDSWAAWAPGLESPEDWLQWAQGNRNPQQCGSPAVSFFPPMYRRRLSQLGKMAVHVAHQCAIQAGECQRLVFASRYGEIQRTARILEGITKGEPVSPTAFSLSVHNAIAGLYSIVQKNGAPTTSLSAGPDTLSSAWLESAGLLQSRHETCQTVTLVYYDEPLPREYEAFQSEVQFPLALALQMRKATEMNQKVFYLQLAEPQPVSQTSAQPPLWQPQALIRLLLDQEQETEGTGSGNRWIWKRHERF